MGSIICAIRGGPASQSTIRHAIQLAKEKNAQLTFLYVVNLDFLSRTMTSRTHSITEDMRQMGELILQMAADTALSEGIDVQTAIREGSVMEQISDLCCDNDAEYVVIGKPHTKKETTILDQEKMDALGSELEQRCRAKLIVVD